MSRRWTMASVLAIEVLGGACDQELPVPVTQRRAPPIAKLSSFEKDELRRAAFRVVARDIGEALRSVKLQATICAVSRAEANPDDSARQSTDRIMSGEGASVFASAAASSGLGYSCERSFEFPGKAAPVDTYIEIIVGPIVRWPGDERVEVQVGVRDVPRLPLGCIYPRQQRCAAERSEGTWRVMECLPGE